jgi:hypothetical protein
MSIRRNLDSPVPAAHARIMTFTGEPLPTPTHVHRAHAFIFARVATRITLSDKELERAIVAFKHRCGVKEPAMVR